MTRLILGGIVALLALGLLGAALIVNLLRHAVHTQDAVDWERWQ